MSKLWFLLLLLASALATGHVTEYQYNVTDITLNGSVSVSIKSEGQVNALLLLLSPVGHEVKVNTNCKASEVLKPENDNRRSGSKTANRKPFSHLPMGASPQKPRAAKVTLEDIVAVRVSGESNLVTDPTTTQSPTIGQEFQAKNCLGLLDQGKNKSGLYTIHPYDCCSAQDVKVFCDMTTDEGGWTVIQRRTLTPNQEDFYRDWESYVYGFGNLTQEFWIGLDNIYALTNQSEYEIRFDLGDFEGQSRWAKYSFFYVGDSSTDYKMEVGGYSGDAGDSFTRHNGRAFETKDHQLVDQCASAYKGAWWFSICHDSNLNGQYLHGEQDSYADGINWRSWKGYYYSLKFSEIKIRPKLPKVI